MALYSEYNPSLCFGDSLSKEDVKKLLIHKLSVKQQNEAQQEKRRKTELARLCQSGNSGINLFRRDEENCESDEYLNIKIKNAEKELLRTKSTPVKKSKSTSENFAESMYSTVEPDAINREIMRKKAVAAKIDSINQKIQHETKKKSVAEVMVTYQKQHRMKLELKLERNSVEKRAQDAVKRSKDFSLDGNVDRSKKFNFKWSAFDIEHEIEDMLSDSVQNKCQITKETVAPRVSDAEVELKMALKYKDCQPEPTHLPVPNSGEASVFYNQPELVSTNNDNSAVLVAEDVELSIPSKPKRVSKKTAKSRVENSPPKKSEHTKKSQNLENDQPNNDSSTVDASKSNGATVANTDKPKPKISISSSAKEKLSDSFIKKSSTNKPAVKKESVEKKVTTSKEEVKTSKNAVNKDITKTTEIQNLDSDVKISSSNKKKGHQKEIPDKRIVTKLQTKSNEGHVETPTQPSSVIQKTKVLQGTIISQRTTQQTPVNKQTNVKENNKTGKGVISVLPLSNDDKKFKKDSTPKSSGIVEKLKNFVGTNTTSEAEDEGSDAEEHHSVKYNIINSIRPVNTESEKARFFKAKFDYNPLFKYYNALPPEVLNKYSNASDLYLPQAVKIMKLLIRKYGSYEKFEANTGGRVLTRQEIIDLVKDYCQRENFRDGEIILNLSEDLLSTASMTRTHGPHGILCVRIGEIHESWIEGLLRHELSTHYIRGCNNLVQPWARSRDRRKFKLLPVNPTEEGLASLHTVLLRQDPLLFRNALLYFSIAMAAKLSFRDLFLKLGEFVHDPNRRWDYCMRAKRGQTDTKKPGCFAKDQVYLTGALNILKNRKNIDFEALMKLGKVSFEDVDRLKKSSGGGDLKNDTLRMPSFMANMKFYRSRLDFIMKANGLSDQDFKQACKQVSSVDECRYDI